MNEWASKPSLNIYFIYFYVFFSLSLLFYLSLFFSFGWRVCVCVDVVCSCVSIAFRLNFKSDSMRERKGGMSEREYMCSITASVFKKYGRLKIDYKHSCHCPKSMWIKRNGASCPLLNLALHSLDFNSMIPRVFDVVFFPLKLWNALDWHTHRMLQNNNCPAWMQINNKKSNDISNRQPNKKKEE